jgi:ABC-type transport system involved in multi-copper enzyme maturation permease subunit
MTATISPYVSTVPAGSDGFGGLLRAEWTKFRTVRGWVIATAVAAILMIVFGTLAGAGSHSSYQPDPTKPAIAGHPYVPIGPGGEAVTDNFSFVHQPLDGDAAITAEVSSVTGALLSGGPQSAGGPSTTTPASIQPWAKAGLIIKENTHQGSAYAAIMVTGAHGVRMQYDYTGDVAGPTGSVSATSPRWLRLTRGGDTVTGYASTDGTTWTMVGTVHLDGLSRTVAAGLFVASPDATTFFQHLGSGGGTGVPSVATATFDHVGLPSGWSDTNWTGTAVGADGPVNASTFHQTGGTVTVSGHGDIAPDVNDTRGIEQALKGAFAGLIVLVVLGVLFITTEYRRGLIRTSLTASPRRGRVLVAKAVIIGSVTFLTTVVGAVIAVPIGEHLMKVNGNFIAPITLLTSVRIIAGTAGLLAVAAILSLAIGTTLRRSAAAVAAAIVIVVLPYILATSGVLPAGPAQWLLRLTPAAGFAIQQSIPAYPQVEQSYTPFNGFFPLAPWAGFAVMCAWAVAALAVATYLLRRRDA